jgi:predicted transcriptional regulator
MLPEIEEIKKRRKNQGLTQKELALLSNVSQSLIAKIESKKVSPSYSVVKRIFETLEKLERKKEVTAKEIMSKKVIYVDKNDSIARAVKLMEEHGYSQLPVLHKNQSVGSITERTILDLIANGKNLSKVLNLPVEKVMGESFSRISENTPLTVISPLLKYSSAILVTRKDKMVGIITKSDLFKVAQK